MMPTKGALDAGSIPATSTKRKFMGLFILAIEDTLEDDVGSAIANLQLFLEELENGSKFLHLLEFAESQILDAKKKLSSDGSDQVSTR